MVYVSKKDFAIVRELMANDMLRVAGSSVAKYLGLNIKESFKSEALTELRELAGSILAEKMDVWPDYCLENEATSEAPLSMTHTAVNRIGLARFAD